MHAVYMCIWVLHKLYYALFLVCLWDALFVSESSPRRKGVDGGSSGEQSELFLKKLTSEREQIAALMPLRDLCLDNARNFLRWWTYIVCFQKGVVQIHLDLSQGRLTQSNYLGRFIPEESTPDRQVYREETATCDTSTDLSYSSDESSRHHQYRQAVVDIQCCDLSKLDERWLRQSRHSLLPDLSLTEGDHASQSELLTSSWLVYEDEARRGAADSSSGMVDTSANTNAFVLSAEEPSTCTYVLTVCSALICEREEDKTGTLQYSTVGGAPSLPHFLLIYSDLIS